MTRYIWIIRIMPMRVTKRHGREITNSATRVTEFFSFSRIKHLDNILYHWNWSKELPIFRLIGISREIIEDDLIKTLVFCFENRSFLKNFDKCDKKFLITGIARFHIARITKKWF